MPRSVSSWRNAKRKSPSRAFMHAPNPLNEATAIRLFGVGHFLLADAAAVAAFEAVEDGAG